jgi:EAL domain-containing protein (putative c-di-GMP-specific phosphodiesterase class I)
MRPQVIEGAGMSDGFGSQGDRAAAGLDLAHSPAELRLGIAEALANNGAGLRLDLQPVCSANGLETVGYEALLRWVHPDLGPILAMETVNAATQAGMAAALDAWVFNEACRIRARWPRSAPYISVNITAEAFLRGDGTALMRRALYDADTDPRGVAVEMPANAVSLWHDAAANLAAGLRGLGVVAALDDFGVARGTILALRAIPFPMVKLHPSLCAGLDGEALSARRALALTTGQVETAHALGTIVVAKSVETLAQLRALEKAGCDAMQGWLLGRPGKVPNLVE